MLLLQSIKGHLTIFGQWEREKAHCWGRVVSQRIFAYMHRIHDHFCNILQQCMQVRQLKIGMKACVPFSLACCLLHHLCRQACWSCLQRWWQSSHFQIMHCTCSAQTTNSSTNDEWITVKFRAQKSAIRNVRRRKKGIKRGKKGSWALT